PGPCCWKVVQASSYFALRWLPSSWRVRWESHCITRAAWIFRRRSILPFTVSSCSPKRCNRKRRRRSRRRSWHSSDYWDWCAPIGPPLREKNHEIRKDIRRVNGLHHHCREHDHGRRASRQIPRDRRCEYYAGKRSTHVSAHDTDHRERHH